MTGCHADCCATAWAWAERVAAAAWAGAAHTFFSGETDKARAGELINVLREARQPVPEALLAFGTTVKKKESKLYGAHFKVAVLPRPLHPPRALPRALSWPRALQSARRVNGGSNCESRACHNCSDAPACTAVAAGWGAAAIIARLAGIPLHAGLQVRHATEAEGAHGWFALRCELMLINPLCRTWTSVARPPK